MKNRVGIRIKTIRKKRQLTQEELAELVDRSVDAISALERGKSLPNFETLERLAEKLDVPIREFFEFEDEESNEQRVALMARVQDVARQLSDSDLEILTTQAEAFLKGRTQT